jgi:hypothetical protein
VAAISFPVSFSRVTKSVYIQIIKNFITTKLLLLSSTSRTNRTVLLKKRHQLLFYHFNSLHIICLSHNFISWSTLRTPSWKRITHCTSKKAVILSSTQLRIFLHFILILTYFISNNLKYV